MGKDVYSPDKYEKSVSFKDQIDRDKIIIGNQDDEFNIIGLNIHQAINKLRGLHPNANNYFSTPSVLRRHDNSCLFQFGNPIRLLHVFVLNDIIISVTVII